MNAKIIAITLAINRKNERMRLIELYIKFKLNAIVLRLNCCRAGEPILQPYSIKREIPLVERMKYCWCGTIYKTINRFFKLDFVCCLGFLRPIRDFFIHLETSTLPLKGYKFWPILGTHSSLTCHTYIWHGPTVYYSERSKL